MKTPHDNFDIALDADLKGHVCIPCFPGTKVPRVKWRPYQSIRPSQEDYRKWFHDTAANVALICTDMVLFDVDDLAKAEVVLHECGDTPHKLWTPNGGIHLGYRKEPGTVVMNQVRIKGLPIDIRTDRGLEMIPHSFTENGCYEWLGPGLLPVEELPVAAVGWTRKRVEKPVTPVVLSEDQGLMVRRARAYLGCVEGAISGFQGHNRTMRAAGILIQKFGLSIEQALPLFLEWNEQCEPRWSKKELLHKLQDAFRLRFERRDQR